MTMQERETRNSRNGAVARCGEAGCGARRGWSRPGIAGLLLVMILFGMNFHLVAWQVYGWAGMLVENRQITDSWAEAAELSFNAGKPCDVCRSVDRAIDASEKPGPATAARGDLAFISFSLTILAERPVWALPPPSLFAPLLAVEALVSSRTTSPPVPPPRALSA